MTLEQYHRARQERLQQETRFRERCPKCLKSASTCFCAHIKVFHSAPRFVILIHRDEARRSVATGRMTHLCIGNSTLIQGYEFSDNHRVNDILQEPGNFPVILYPGTQAVNLSQCSLAERRELFPNGKQLVVFVLDATWAQAKRMKRMSRNLDSLPLICFTPTTPSTFRIRKQPKPNYYSTIEAVHKVIDLLDPKPTKPHDNMLSVFDRMVEQQLKYRNKFEAMRTCRETRRIPATL